MRGRKGDVSLTQKQLQGGLWTIPREEWFHLSDPYERSKCRPELQRSSGP